MNFGFRLIKAREILGFNQNEFADKISIAPQSLSRYEKNKVKPSIELLEKLTNMFSININWLLTGNGNILMENQVEKINYKEETIKTLENLKKEDLKSVYHFAKSKEFNK